MTPSLTQFKTREEFLASRREEFRKLKEKAYLEMLREGKKIIETINGREVVSYPYAYAYYNLLDEFHEKTAKLAVEWAVGKMVGEEREIKKIPWHGAGAAYLIVENQRASAYNVRIQEERALASRLTQDAGAGKGGEGVI